MSIIEAAAIMIPGMLIFTTKHFHRDPRVCPPWYGYPTIGTGRCRAVLRDFNVTGGIWAQGPAN
jgi:hypothetical protein